MPTSPSIRTCKTCGATSDNAWFDKLAVRICGKCQIERRKERLKARRPKALPGAANYRRTRIRPRIGESTAHLAWIRTHYCACGPGCGTVTHAHHVRTGTGGGIGKKPADRWAIPLCPRHHAELHTKGARTFETKYGLDLRALAEELALRSPHLSAYSGVSSTAAVRGEVPDRRDA